MPGTTLVTPKQAQELLQNSKYRQKHKYAYIRQKRLRRQFTSRYKIAVTSQISSLNAENAPMVSQCTGNMPGTTLVTPEQA